MAIYALTGNDTFILNDRVINDLTNGTTVTIEFPNEKAGISTGKNGNTVYSENKQGTNVNVSLRVILGSNDDSFLNGLNIQQDKDLPGFSLMNGAFSKRVGDGKGGIKYINYTLLGGIFRQNITSQENVEGDTEQGTAVYNLFFASAERSMI